MGVGADMAGGGAFVGYLIYLLHALLFSKILCQWGSITCDKIDVRASYEYIPMFFSFSN